MPGLLWLIPAVPLASFLALALVGSRVPPRIVSLLGVGAIAASTAVTLAEAAAFLGTPPEGGAWVEPLWRWIDVDGFRPMMALRLDALSLVMSLVVTFVSLVIHLYSVGYMAGDEGYARFFAYMNLFVASMATLVLADDLLLLFLGWEGVGLCSYLLIGFWYRDPENGAAARKAFLVTRVGDTALSVALLLLFTRLGTLQIHGLMSRAVRDWPSGSALPVLAAALILGGAVGKSAQLPLQVWLPDAMAGPTPSSALIHAATMVTAGVYLVARTHLLFQLAPPVMLVVAVVGGVTLLLAGCSALVQHDIKRILAYSTVSQIGYMFLACGVGAWSAAIFHLVTHAFFKALLFMSAGVVIQAMHEEHDIFRMGGLRRPLPAAFWGFLIGGASLAGLPVVTAGFYSKGLIVYSAWAGPGGAPLLWLASVVGALLTSLYIFRLIFVVFGGSSRTIAVEVAKRPDWTELTSMGVLAALSVLGGLLYLPPWLGDHPLLGRFLERTLPAPSRVVAGLSELGSEGVVTLAFAIGLLLAWWLYRVRRPLPVALAGKVGRALHRFWFEDWGFDLAYQWILVRPFIRMALANKDDMVDQFYRFVGWGTVRLHQAAARSETGRVRFYAGGIVLGSVLLLFLVVLFR